MRRQWLRACIVCLLAAAPVLHAVPPPRDDSAAAPEPEELKRRRPSLFHRAAAETPAAQLALAGQLAREGRNLAARRAYLALVHAWHGAPEASAAQLALARLLYERGRYADAFDEFQYLVTFFPGRFPHDEVLEKQFAAANMIRSQRHAGFLVFPGFRDPGRAIPLFEKVVANAPRWHRAPEAQFQIGAIHEERKEDDAAIVAYEVLRLRYPESPLAAEAELRRALALCRLARSNPRDEASCRTAISALGAFVSDRPGHPERDRAAASLDSLRESLAELYFERARYYDKRGRPKAALVAYEDFLRSFATSSLGDQARQRVEQLKRQIGVLP